MNKCSKQIAFVAIAFIALIAVGGLTVMQANIDGEDGGTGSTSSFDVNNYLKYVPELKPGNSVGGSIEFDESDAYQFLKFYADSFEGFEESANEYNRIIINAVKTSTTLDGFSANICEQIASKNGDDVDVTVSPNMSASIAFTFDVVGTTDSPELIVKVVGGVDSSVEGNLIADGKKTDFTFSAKVPVMIYSKVIFSNEKIPQSIDAMVKTTFDISGTMIEGGETKSMDEKLDIECGLSASIIDKITIREVNSLLDGSSPVMNKEFYFMFYSKEGDFVVSSVAGNITIDLTMLKLNDAISDLKLNSNDIDVMKIKGQLKDLKKNVLPDYADIKWIAKLFDVDEKTYAQVKVIATPYLEQITDILRDIWNHSANEHLTSYYIDWNNNKVHDNQKDSISSKVASVPEITFDKVDIKDGSFCFSGPSDGLMVINYEYYKNERIVNVTIPNSFCGMNVTEIENCCFNIPPDCELKLTILDSMREVPVRILRGEGKYEGAGGSVIIYDEAKKFGIKYDLWMEEGKCYASVVGPYNAETTENIDLIIPEKIKCGGREFTIVEICDRSFQYCQKIKTLSIPDSVKSIGNCAFEGCTKLEKVEIGSGAVILENTFIGCTSLNDVTVKSSEIEFRGTFGGCSSLSELKIENIKKLSIYGTAFTGTKIGPLDKIYNGKSIVEFAQNIVGYSFSDFEGPGGSIVEKDGINYKMYKEDGLYYCNASCWYGNITEASIPSDFTIELNGIKFVGKIRGVDIFSCNSLEKISIPNSVAKISLAYLPSIDSIAVDAKDISITNCSNLKKIEIGSSVSELNLRNLPMIEGITIKSNEYVVQKIDGYTLITHDDRLVFCFGEGESFTLPSEISEFDYGALSSVKAKELIIRGNISSNFELSDTTTKITLDKDVTQIPDMFRCYLEEYSVKEGNEHLKSIDGVLFSKDGVLLKYPAGKDGNEYVVPEGTKSISKRAFADSKLTAIYLNSDLREVDADAFKDCNDLVTLTMRIQNNDVFVKDGFLWSGSTIIWYEGNQDVLIIPECKRISHDAFKKNTPKVIVIPPSVHSDIYLYDRSIIISSSQDFSVFYEGNDRNYRIHWIELIYDTFFFSTDGKTLTCTAGNWWSFAADSILVDGKKYASGSSCTFTIDQLSEISSISATYQPTKYEVIFETSGGPTVPSQDVYFRYRANVPSDPYRSGFTFTGWYSDAKCTKLFDFETPISKPSNDVDNKFYIYAGWKVNQSEIVPVTPPVPSTPGSSGGNTNPDGSKTVEKIDYSKDDEGNDVKKVESETTYHDGSKVVSNSTTTTKKTDDSTEMITESTEVVTDSSGKTTGSTSVNKTEKETDKSKSSVTSTVSKDADGGEVRKVTTVKIESKENNVTTSGEVVKEKSGEEKIDIGTSITVESDTGEMSVTHDQMQAAIKQTSEAIDAIGVSGKSGISLTVEIKTNKYDDRKASVEMSAESFKVASESDVNLKLTSQVGSMVLDKGASETLSSKGGNVSVSLSVANKALLNSEQKATIGDAPVYDLKALAGEESIHQLGGKVTVTIPYTLKEGDDPRTITVYYVNDEGVCSKKVTTYDPTTHSLTFITDHFSYYMISNSADLEPEQQNDNGMIIVISVAVVAILAVAAVMFVVKKR